MHEKYFYCISFEFIFLCKLLIQCYLCTLICFQNLMTRIINHTCSNKKYAPYENMAYIIFTHVRKKMFIYNIYNICMNNYK